MPLSASLTEHAWSSQVQHSRPKHTRIKGHQPRSHVNTLLFSSSPALKYIHLWRPASASLSTMNLPPLLGLEYPHSRRSDTSPPPIVYQPWVELPQKPFRGNDKMFVQHPAVYLTSAMLCFVVICCLSRYPVSQHSPVDKQLTRQLPFTLLLFCTNRRYHARPSYHRRISRQMHNSWHGSMFLY